MGAVCGSRKHRVTVSEIRRADEQSIGTVLLEHLFEIIIAIDSPPVYGRGKRLRACIAHTDQRGIRILLETLGKQVAPNAHPQNCGAYHGSFPSHSWLGALL